MSILELILNPLALILSLFNKNFEFLIARKYVFKFRREFNFITIITFISFLGITLGIAALISVLAIFAGFRDFAENQIRAFDPHIRVVEVGEDVAAKFELFLNSQANRIKFSKSLQGKVVLSKRGALQAAEINALEINKAESVSGVSSKIAGGKYSLDNSDGVYRASIGFGLAEKLKVFPGDTIFALSPDIIESSVKTMNANSEIPILVSSYFMSYSKDYDDSYIIASLELGEELFTKREHNYINYDIRLNSIDDIEAFSADIRKDFPALKTLTWYDLHSDMFNIMKLERVIVFLVLSLIVVIAAFNLLASLAMIVVEKQKDIAILKACGCDDNSIRKIFIGAGAYIGLSAIYWGTLLGLAFCYGQQYFHWFKLDTGKYLISALPITIDYTTTLIIDIFAVALSLVSTIAPAKIAAKQKIGEFLSSN
jgi:lipoprotein-releasing system permease protein